MINYILAESIFQTKMDFIMFTIIAAISTVLMVFVGYKLLQMLQLSGYKIKGYLVWFKETKCAYVSRLFMLMFLSLAAMIMTNVLLADFFVNKILSYASILFYFLFSSFFIINLFTAKQKTPLKYTRRMQRLLAVYAVLVALFTWLVEYIGFRFIPYLSFGLISITPMFLPLLVMFAYFITLPFEKMISNSYIKKTKKKLKDFQNLKIIGITGSYGKTSIKNILTTILSVKFKVCPTPASYNTPMGLAKTVLSNLNKDDEIFIAEMGAKQVGDIKELCDIIHPQIGIITGIGNQHLITFGSTENIIKTKAEIADYVFNNGGKCYINTDSQNAKKLAESFENVVTISINDTSKNDLFAEDVVVSSSGSTFSLRYGGNVVKCKTILLGEHNISNILLAARVALDFGMSLSEIAKGIENLRSVPHRLEIIKSTSNYTIIDDSYNSSVEGSKASVLALSKFKGKKFVITPGLVELGSEQFNSNFDYGRDLAAVCDYVIIDSPINFDAISSGLVYAGFDEEKIIQAGNLTQAVNVLNTLASCDDVVLFENDLPDNYS